MSKRAWCGAILAAAAVACNALLGIEEPIERSPDGSTGGTDAGTGGGAGADGSAGAAGSGGTGGMWWDAGDGGTEDPPCDVNEPADANAVYVSVATGNDESGDGSQLAPLRTIAAAIGVARAAGKIKIVLEVGVYAEAVVLENLPKGVTIEGGWKRSGATSWKRDCSPGFKNLTLIQAPGAIAVVSESLTAPSGLAHLTVATKANGASPGAQSGETLIGVLVRGDQSAFSLHNVAAYVGRGGNGGDPGTMAIAGTASCDGVTGCGATQGLDAPAASDGQPGDDATATGTFAPTGYTPTDGTSGKTPGDDAAHGGKGGPGDCVPNAFKGCITDPPGTCINNVGEECASPGKCGCGGLGGASGTPGRGGGASVGLLVAGTGSVVNVDYTELSTAGGGDGSAGGLGGEGGPGTSGSKGADKTVNVGATCAGEPFCTQCPPCQYNVSWGSEPGTNVTLIGGTPGGKGGKGGRGGQGGHGSGGPSYAIVKLGNAKVLLDDKTLTSPGPGGLSGGGSAAAGESAPELTAP